MKLSPNAKSNVELFFGIVGIITTIVAVTWVVSKLLEYIINYVRG